MNTLILDAEIGGEIHDVRIRAGLIAEVGRELRAGDEEVVHASGGALLPGLHDHHVHLLASAAANRSIDCGPPRVRTADELRKVLQEAAVRLPAEQWVRGIGYHESVAGMLDRNALDGMVPDRPVRVQHRGGALWIVNSTGLAALHSVLDDTDDVERDEQGEPTGRLWRYDARLRAVLGRDEPDLAALGARLTALGITGVTDATPDEDGTGRVSISAAVRDGRVPQRVHFLGASASGDDPAAGLSTGPRKLLLRDHDLPGLDELIAAIGAARADGRAVAVHCVTRESLILTLAALDSTGTVTGDRIEHAAVVPPEMRTDLARLGLAVVTQPSFVTDRGDDYLTAVDPADRELLYPYASLLAAGVRVAPSSDAPFGDIDPWRTIRAAAQRTTPSGATVVDTERVAPHIALAGFLSPADDPGGPPRRVAVGQPADLCLLAEPLAAALTHPDADLVTTVLRDGNILHRR